MEKIVYLIVKSYFDSEGNLKEVSPLYVCSSKLFAERLFSSYKQIEEVTNKLVPNSVSYDLKELVLYE